MSDKRPVPECSAAPKIRGFIIRLLRFIVVLFIAACLLSIIARFVSAEEDTWTAPIAVWGGAAVLALADALARNRKTE